MVRTLSAMVLAMTMLAATALAETSPAQERGLLADVAQTIVALMSGLDFDPRELNLRDAPPQEEGVGDARE